jgi:hypothetical protein
VTLDHSELRFRAAPCRISPRCGNRPPGRAPTTTTCRQFAGVGWPQIHLRAPPGTSSMVACFPSREHMRRWVDPWQHYRIGPSGPACSFHCVAVALTPFFHSLAHALAWPRARNGLGFRGGEVGCQFCFPEEHPCSSDYDLRSPHFGQESAHVGQRERWPRAVSWLVHTLPNGLDPSYIIWAFFARPDGLGQYQLVSWARFRLWAIFWLVISLSFNFLFSLLGLHSN